jgi:hypothetical protein
MAVTLRFYIVQGFETTKALRREKQSPENVRARTI